MKLNKQNGGIGGAKRIIEEYFSNNEMMLDNIIYLSDVVDVNLLSLNINGLTKKILLMGEFHKNNFNKINNLIYTSPWTFTEILNGQFDVQIYIELYSNYLLFYQDFFENLIDKTKNYISQYKNDRSKFYGEILSYREYYLGKYDVNNDDFFYKMIEKKVNQEIVNNPDINNDIILKQIKIKIIKNSDNEVIIKLRNKKSSSSGILRNITKNFGENIHLIDKRGELLYKCDISEDSLFNIIYGNQENISDDVEKFILCVQNYINELDTEEIDNEIKLILKKKGNEILSKLMSDKIKILSNLKLSLREALSMFLEFNAIIKLFKNIGKSDIHIIHTGFSHVKNIKNILLDMNGKYEYGIDKIFSDDTLITRLNYKVFGIESLRQIKELNLESYDIFRGIAQMNQIELLDRYILKDNVRLLLPINYVLYKLKFIENEITLEDFYE